MLRLVFGFSAAALAFSPAAAANYSAQLAAPTSQRFIASANPDTSSLPLNVVTNWTAGLKNR